MPEIGKINRLPVTKERNIGVYLDGGELGNILLQRKEVPKGCKIGDLLEVFIFYDADGCLAATTRKPKITVGECAFLKVISVTDHGAFLDWGMERDLLVHPREQQEKMVKGKSYLVFAYIHAGAKVTRIVATSKLDSRLDLQPASFQEGQDVALLVSRQTELGYQAIINNTHRGLLYKNEVFRPLHPGEKLKGFIKKLRGDGKIDLGLQKPGPEKVGDLASQIIARLHQQGGFMPLSDTSKPATIHAIFGVSKKTFKKALGALYKRRVITFVKDGISLTEK